MNFLLARSTYEVLNTIKYCHLYHFDHTNKGPRSTPWGKVLYTSSSLRYVFLRLKKKEEEKSFSFSATMIKVYILKKTLSAVFEN